MRFSKKQQSVLVRSMAALLSLPAVSVEFAYAQSAGIAAAAGDAEKIVVTARRREELIQDVPSAVSAFSAAALENFGVQNITALTDLVPNTTLKTSRATNTTLTAFIRGIGQQDPVAGYEQGVGIYLDDVYLARPQGALMDIYDLDRIEVLRGPQGTLYGRNTIGGAVKYVTRKLSAKPELDVKASLGSYGEKNLVVRGSTPVSETLRVGGTIASFNRDGFGKNVVNGADNYDKDVTAGRISIELMPTKSLFVRFVADRTVDNSNPKEGYRLTPGLAPASEPVLDGKYDTRAGLYSVLGHQQQVTTHGESLLVDWTLNPTLSFKSITATRGGESYAPIDFDSLQGKLFEAPSIYHDRQTSQEFQLTYTGQRLQGVAGLFYMNTNAYNRFDAILPTLGGLSGLTLDDVDTRTWAVFADASYSLTDTLDVNAGGRFTSDQRRARIFKATYAGLLGSPTLGNPAALPSTFLPYPQTDMDKANLDRTDTKFTPKIGLGWKISPAHNLYASYSEGFKGGMFDPRMDLGGNPNSATSLVKRKGVEPEEVSSYELGLKSRFNGGRIQTNAAIFSMDYRNVQIPGSIPIYDASGTVTGFAGNVTNAGKAKINGIELEALARLTDAFSMSAMYSHIDAKYQQWLVASGTTLLNIANAAEFQNTPKDSANVSATYEWPLAVFGRSGGMSLGNSISYKSKVNQFEIVKLTGIAALDVNVPQAQLLAQDGYSIWNASLVWASKDRNLKVGLYGRNLTDKRYKVAGYPFASFSNTITAFYGDPRTITATVDMKF